MAKKGDWLMAYEKFGSDNAQIAGFGGGVISEDGNVLLSGSADTGEALLFGPAAMREIQSNVANGDFALGPQDPLAEITAEDNPLPYWTVVQTGTAPTISAAIVASATTASGNALTLTAAASAGVGSSFELKRYVPIAGNANRSSAYHPEVFVGTTTGGAADKTRVRITLTATAVDADLNALTISATANETASTLTTKSLFTNWFVPDRTAAFILLSIKVDVPTTSPVAAVTVPVLETRIARSEGAIAFPALQNPAGDPWIIQNENLTFEIFPQTELDPSLTMISNGGGGTYSIDLSANNADGTLNLTGNGWATLSGGITSVLGEFVDIASDNDVDIDAPTGVNVSNALNVGGTLGVLGNINIGVSDTSVAGDITFKGGNGGSIRAFSAAAGNDSIGIYNTSGSAFTALVADTFFPGGQGTFRLDHDGNFDLNDSLDVAGNVTATGSLQGSTIYSTSAGIAFAGSPGGDVVLTGADTSVPISGNGELNAIPNTTTATTNSARWVLISGSTYGLRRDSSTRRVKTNIVEANDLVLAAAKNLRAVHYEALEKDAEGNIVPSGKHTLGLIAEEIVEAGLGCAVTYDGEGLPDGYDERVLIAALLHRVNDLEKRLSKLEK
jgi:hypothetical protein